MENYLNDLRQALPEYKVEKYYFNGFEWNLLKRLKERIKYNKFIIQDYDLHLDFVELEKRIERELRKDEKKIFIIDNLTYIQYSTINVEQGLQIQLPRSAKHTMLMKYVCSDGDMAYTYAPQDKSIKVFKQQLSEQYMCLVCMQSVENTKICNSCFQAYCNKCINKLKLYENKCCHCNQTTGIYMTKK